MVDKAGEAESAGPVGEVEELPTMPPAPRLDQATLRWATPGPATVPAPVDGEPTAPVFIPPGPPAAPPAVPSGRVGEGDDEAGGGGGRSRRVTALLVLVGGLLALAGTAVVIVWRVEQVRAPKARAPVTAPAKPSPEELFGSLLGTSATAHKLVQTAVDGPCGTATPQSQARAGLVAQIGRADALHRYVLAGMQADQAALLKMPAGRALSIDLVRATDASIQADTAYAAWLDDLQVTGCYSAPTNDIHYRAATEASLAAGRAKAQLAAGWAGIASRFHLRSWTAADL